MAVLNHAVTEIVELPSSVVPPGSTIPLVLEPEDRLRPFLPGRGATAFDQRLQGLLYLRSMLDAPNREDLL